MKKNTIIALLVVGCIAGVGGYFLGKQSSVPVRRGEPTPKQQTITEDEQRPEVTALASRHSAVVGWHRGLSDRSPNQPIYTAELQHALMPEPKRPVLIVGQVTDFVDSPEPNTRAVTLHWMGGLFFNIVFEMMCPTAEAEKLLQARRDLTKSVAAIVLVDGIRRKERAQQQDQENSLESFGLFFQRFHATGKCSEMLVLGGK